MGSHHRQVPILIQDDKLDCFGLLRKKIGSDKNGLAFYSGPVLPPRDDGSPIKLVICLFVNRGTGNWQRSEMLPSQRVLQPRGPQSLQQVRTLSYCCFGRGSLVGKAAGGLRSLKRSATKLT